MIAAVVALCVGVGIGFAFGLRVRDARRPEIDTTDSVGEQRHEPREVTDALIDAADRLDLAMVLSGPSNRPAYRNRVAVDMRGTHVGVIVDEHVDKAIERALAGERTDKRIDLHGPPRVSLELVAEPLDNGWAFVIVDDVSDRTRIDAMRTDFIANVSHELKTPVGAIAVLAEMLDAEDDVEVIQRMSARIVEESHRAATTIDDLLELTRIESARVADDVINVNDVVDAAVHRGRDVDPTKRVTVTAFGVHTEILLRADRRQLTSAIGNLVENAVKYSDDDGIVQVRTRVDDRWIEVMVTDQGVGIPQRDLDRVFERFYRVDRARSRETGGTGLGLSIVRHVASNHGGECVVSSQEGEGSTFVLRLPSSLRVSPPATTVDPPHDEGAASVTRPMLSGIDTGDQR